MKKLLPILSGIFLCLSGIQAQIYKSEGMQMFLLNQPDAASEATGRGNAASIGNPFLSTYNPASSMFLEGVSAQISGLELSFAYNAKASHNSYSAGVALGKYGALSFNLMHLGWNFDVLSSSQDLLPLGAYSPHTNIYSINYSHFIFNGLSAGVNLNYYDNETGSVHLNDLNNAVLLDNETGRVSKTAWTVDAGLMNKFSVPSPFALHEVYLGLSISNLFNTKITREIDTRYAYQYFSSNLKTWDYSYIDPDGRNRMPLDIRPYLLPVTEVTGNYLPSIMRFAAAYEIKPNAKTGDFNIINGKVLLQYQDLLNSRYYTRYSAGAEIKLLEIVSLRFGWLNETRENAHIIEKGSSSYFLTRNYASTTYGFGLDVPVKKLIYNLLPLTLRFDYTSIANRSDLLPRYYTALTEGELTSVYTINLSYAL